MGEEKRIFPRGWRGRVKIGQVAVSPRQPAVICKNISAGGMLLETSQPLEPGQVVRFALSLPGLEKFAERIGMNPAPFAGDIIYGRAKVVRVRSAATAERWNNGLQFLGFNSDTVHLINELVHDKAGTRPEWLQP